MIVCSFAFPFNMSFPEISNRQGMSRDWMPSTSIYLRAVFRFLQSYLTWDHLKAPKHINIWTIPGRERLHLISSRALNLWKPLPSPLLYPNSCLSPSQTLCKSLATVVPSCFLLRAFELVCNGKYCVSPDRETQWEPSGRHNKACYINWWWNLQNGTSL